MAKILCLDKKILVNYTDQKLTFLILSTTAKKIIVCLIIMPVCLIDYLPIWYCLLELSNLYFYKTLPVCVYLCMYVTNRLQS